MVNLTTKSKKLTTTSHIHSDSKDKLSKALINVGSGKQCKPPSEKTQKDMVDSVKALAQLAKDNPSEALPINYSKWLRKVQKECKWCRLNLNIKGMKVIIIKQETAQDDDFNKRAPIIYNSNAKDPSYAELINFLNKDKTYTKTYVKKQFECGAFAAELHNNAEKVGIRCGYVEAHADEGKEAYGHAFNVFNTTDKGAIFVDPTHKNMYSEANFFAKAPIIDSKNYWNVGSYIYRFPPYAVVIFW